MEICTPDTSVEYEFYNTIYNSKLGKTSKIEANSKNNFKNIENTYLDIYLVLKKMEIKEHQKPSLGIQVQMKYLNHL